MTDVIPEKGQVWKSKTNAEQYAVVSVNWKEKKVFLCGVVDSVDPIFPFEYLFKNYQIVEDWS